MPRLYRYTDYDGQQYQIEMLPDETQQDAHARMMDQLGSVVPGARDPRGSEGPNAPQGAGSDRFAQSASAASPDTRSGVARWFDRLVDQPGRALVKGIGLGMGMPGDIEAGLTPAINDWRLRHGYDTPYSRIFPTGTELVDNLRRKGVVDDSPQGQEDRQNPITKGLVGAAEGVGANLPLTVATGGASLAAGQAGRQVMRNFAVDQLAGAAGGATGAFVEDPTKAALAGLVPGALAQAVRNPSRARQIGQLQRDIAGTDVPGSELDAGRFFRDEHGRWAAQQEARKGELLGDLRSASVEPFMEVPTGSGASGLIGGPKQMTWDQTKNLLARDTRAAGKAQGTNRTITGQTRAGHMRQGIVQDTEQVIADTDPPIVSLHPTDLGGAINQYEKMLQNNPTTKIPNSSLTWGDVHSAVRRDLLNAAHENRLGPQTEALLDHIDATQGINRTVRPLLETGSGARKDALDVYKGIVETKTPEQLAELRRVFPNGIDPVAASMLSRPDFAEQWAKMPDYTRWSLFPDAKIRSTLDTMFSPNAPAGDILSARILGAILGEKFGPALAQLGQTVQGQGEAVGNQLGQLIASKTGMDSQSALGAAFGAALPTVFRLSRLAQKSGGLMRSAGLGGSAGLNASDADARERNALRLEWDDLNARRQQQ